MAISLRTQIRTLLIATLLGGTVAQAQPLGSVIDEADVRIFDAYSHIEIHFNVPVSVEHYAPLTHGRLLQIDVALRGAPAIDTRARVGATEWIATAPANAATLYEYLRFDRYEAGRGRLNLKLMTDLNYSVYVSSDARSVIIAVITADLPRKTVDKLPARAAPLPPPPVPAAPVVAAERPVDLTNLPRARLQRPAPAPVTAAPPLPAALTNPPAAARTLPSTLTDPLDGLLEEARQAMVKRDYDRAIALYTKIIEHHDAPQAREALEFLGVAREKKRQLAHAKAVYTDYLQRFPQGEGSERVRQRLAALLALEQTPNGSRSTQAKVAQEGWQTYGSFSQYYRYADLSVKRHGDPRFTDTESLTAVSALITRLDVNSRLHSEDWDARARVNGGYLNDFLQRANAIGSYALLSDAYIDVRHRHSDISARLGRQYSSTGGVAGRFNGAVVGVPLTETLRLNTVAGVPVDLARNMTVDDTERFFYGVNLDIAVPESRWQYNLFALEQRIDGMIDRRDVGAELRFSERGNSLFLRGDYDTEFSELGGAMLIGNWAATATTSLNLSLDYRYNPLLTTRNALIGQIGVSSIDDLKKVYSKKEIRELAMDRSQRSSYSTLSVTQQLTTDLQLYGSASLFSYDDLPASGGVPEMPGSGNEYEYDAELIFSNLWQAGDTTNVGLRYYDGDLSTRTAAGIDARFLFGQNLRINPRLWVELRETLRDDSEQWVYRPALRLEYTWTPRLHIDFEVSSDISQQDIPSVGSEDVIGNYAELGYWYEF